VIKSEQPEENLDYTTLPKSVQMKLPNMLPAERKKIVIAQQKKDRLISYASEVKVKHKPTVSEKKAQEIQKLREQLASYNRPIIPKKV